MKNLQASVVKQRTLKQVASCTGVGLRSGKVIKVSVKPGEQSSGINFYRTDISEGNSLIKAHWKNVIDNHASIILSNEQNITVSNVEYLLAALLGCGIDNAIVELDGPEVPIMDGSAAPFVSMIEIAGTIDQNEYRKVIWIQNAIEIQSCDKYALIYPSYTTRLTVEINSSVPAIGIQKYSLTLPDECFYNNIAKARIFGFTDASNSILQPGISGKNLPENITHFESDEFVLENGQRYYNEFVRHKILKIMGVLALIGAPVVGHLYARMPDQELINLLIKKMFQTPDAWSYQIDCFVPSIMKRIYC